MGFEPMTSWSRTKRSTKLSHIPLEIKNGRGEKIRTSDPLHPMQVRYQAALRPELLNIESTRRRRGCHQISCGRLAPYPCRALP